MGKCKWCEKSGLFFNVDKDGVCKDCSSLIRINAQSVLEWIGRIEEMNKKTADIEIAYNNYSSIVDRLKEYLKYEEKGINVFNKKTSEIIKDYENDKNKFLIEVIKKAKKKVIDKSLEVKKESTREKYMKEFNDNIPLLIDKYFYIESVNYKNEVLEAEKLKFKTD